MIVRTLQPRRRPRRSDGRAASPRADTAAQLYALLADVAPACLMEVEAELADPSPGQSLAAASGPSRQGNPAESAE